jgi:hypothetical protein
MASLRITESPGSTSLFDPGKRLDRMDPQGSKVKNVQKVEMVTIDGWLKGNGNPPIQLMKFDIQGGELHAFRGAADVLYSSTLLVYTEITFNPLYEGGAMYGEIDMCLREYGFVLYDIFKPKYDTNNLLMWGNALFLHSGRLGV